MNLLDYLDGPAAASSSEGTGGTDRIASFVAEYRDVADAAAERLGVSPGIILAQLGLETGWGKSVIPGTNNLGNIKSFNGTGIGARDNMTGSVDRYRAYDTPLAFADDYASLLERKYRGTLNAGDDVEQFASALAKGGYAEDPNYASKIKAAYSKVADLIGTDSNVPKRKTALDWLDDGQVSPVEPTGPQSNALNAALENAYKEVGEPQGFLARTATSFAKGSGSLVKGIGWLVGSDTIQSLGENAEKYWSEIQMKDPEMARQLQAVESAQGFTGTLKALKDNPRALADFIVSSVPAMVPGMGGSAVIGNVAGKIAFNSALKAGAARGVAEEAARLAAAKAAEKAAIVAGTAGNMASEGITEGAISGAETQRFLEERGVSREEAVQIARETALKVGAATTLLAGVGAGFETKAVLGKLPGSGVAGFVKNVGKEAAEEGLQNPAQDYFEVQAKQQVDPTQEFDPGKSVALGVATGGVMGAGIHGAGRAATMLAGEQPAAPAKTADEQHAEAFAGALDSVSKAGSVDEAIAAATAASAVPVNIDLGQSADQITREQQIRAIVGSEAMRGWMATLDPATRQEILGTANTALSQGASSALRAQSIEALYQKLSDGGVFAAHEENKRGRSIQEASEPMAAGAKPSAAEQFLRNKEMVSELTRSPEWEALLSRVDAATRTGMVETLASISNPRLPAAYRNTLASTVIDFARRAGVYAGPRQLPTPSSSMVADAAGNVGTQSGFDMQEEADRRAQLAAEREREAMGLTDRGVQAAIQRNARQQGAQGEPLQIEMRQAPRLPAPDQRIYVDSAGNAGSQGAIAQQSAENQRAIAEAMQQRKADGLSDRGVQKAIARNEQGRAWREKTAKAYYATKIRSPNLINEVLRAETPETAAEVVRAMAAAKRGSPKLLDALHASLVGKSLQEYQSQTAQEIEAAAREAATSPENNLPEPTEAQKEAGNYKKAHVNVQGLDITIENPRGSERSGKRPDGSTWKHTMSDHYGYVKRTTGADGEQVDVYVGTNPDSDRVYVVDQLNQKDGSFDEHKVMIGFNSREAAVEAYKSNFDAGWKVGTVTEMSMEQFKDWLQNGETAKPLGGKESGNQVRENLPPTPETAPANDVSGKSESTAQSATEPQQIGREVDRYTGMYKKGMTEFNARMEAKRRNRAQDKVMWVVENAEAQFGADRYVIVGYEKPAPVAENTLSVAENTESVTENTESVAAPRMAARVERPGAGRTGAQAARERLKRENPFLAFIASEGVSLEDKADIGMEKGRAGNPLVPGFGPVFRRTGKRLDILAQRAMEEGFLTQDDIDSLDDTGGTRKLADMINRAVAGKEVIQPAGVIDNSAEVEMNRRNDEAVLMEARNLGIETDGLSIDQVYDAVIASHAEQEQARAEVGAESVSEYDEIAGIADDIEALDSDIPFDLDDVRQVAASVLSDEEINELFKTGTQQKSSGGAEKGADGDAREGAQGARTPQEGRTTEDFQLTTQDRADLEKKEARANDQTVADRELADKQRDAFTLSAPPGTVEGEAQAMSNSRQADLLGASSSSKIEDFGEKIGGARKDVWTSFKDDLNAVSDDEIGNKPLSKVWPAPDYQALIDGGMDAEAVAVVRALRDEVPAKPRSPWKVKRWAEQVKMLRGFANDVMDGKTPTAKLRTEMNRAGAILRGVNGRIDLYMEVGHAKSLEGIRFQEHHYSIYKGQENVNLWVVEKDAAATAFSNWPHEIATGKTKEEAIANFKAKYDTLNTDKVSKQPAFDIYSELRVDGYFIGKKIGRNYAKLAGPFTTVKEARQYRDQNTAELQDKLEKFKEIPRERRDVNEPRVGVDMRNGQDVTPEMFGETFKFRGVEFGNWVEQKRRQQDLNDAFDAMMDMAAILNVPPAAISLNGQLGLAFGARGSGGVNPAAAHYEPGKVVINLTKRAGAGSLGHEWWHALDNYFSRMRGNGDAMMTEALDVSLASRGSNFVHRGEVRREMIVAYGEVVKAIKETALKARSQKLDNKRSKEYWTTGAEMSARAFESYLISKLQDQNASNDYLANIVSEETWRAAESMGFELDDSYPYPTAGEVPVIRAAFDKFFQTVETKQDDAGNVAMFYRSGDAVQEAIADGVIPDTELKPLAPFKTKTEASMFRMKNRMSDVQIEQTPAGWVFQPKASPMTDAEKADARGDVEALNKSLKADGVQPVKLLTEAPSTQHELARAIGKVFGVKVLFVSDNPSFEGAAHHGVAFLKANMQRPELAIAGHEVFHTLEQTNPKLAEKLLAQVRQYLQKDVVADRKTREELVSEGQISERYAAGEVLADINGAMWMDPRFWREMRMRDVSLFRRVAYLFMEVLTKAYNSLAGTRFDVNALVTDVDAVRSLIAQTWADHNQGRGETAVIDDAPKYSRVALGDLTAEQEAAAERVLGKPKTLKERAQELRQNIGKNLVQGIFDQFAPIRSVDEKAYILSRMSKGGDSTLEAMMIYGKPFVDSDGFYDVDYSQAKGKAGFATIMAPLQGEQDRFFLWVAAQRAERLKAIGLENLFSDKDIQTLKTLADGKMESGASRKEAYAKALMGLNEFNDAVLKIAVDSGLIDEETRQMYRNTPYVPFYRLQEEGVTGFGMKAGLVNQTAWKKLKGGTDKLNEDLLANTLQNWSHLISAAAKNRAAKATLEAAVRTGIAQEVPNGTPGKGLVSFRDGGKDRTFLVNDPYVMDAVSALEYSGLGPWAKPLTKMKHILTIGVTANPTFKIRNLMRDSIQAIGTSDLSYNPLNNLKAGWLATAQDSETRAKMLASGGMIRFGSMLDGATADRARSMIHKFADTDVMLKDANAIKKFWQQTVHPALEAYQEIGDRGEQVNRAALYEQLRKKGMSHGEASFWARDLMDFSSSGKWQAVRFLTQVVPFMNARLQGLYKLGRAGMEDYKRFGAVVGTVAMASIALMLAYVDDDDWKKREDWDRQNYWWFKVGDTAFRIPKPFELGAIGTIAEMGIQMFADDEMTGKRFMSNLGDIVGNQLSMNPIPQMVKPMLDVYANKDGFTKRPIESMAMQRLRPEDRVNERTSEVARFLGSLGLPDPVMLMMGNYDPLSPVKIDALTRGYFSWLGTMATTALDYGIRPMLDRGERPAMQLKEVFVIGNFAESLPTNSSRYVSQMYEHARDIEQAYASYQQAVKQGDYGKALEILEEQREEIAAYRSIEGVKRQENEINARINKIEANQAMPAETKRRLIDMLSRQRDQIARQLKLAG